MAGKIAKWWMPDDVVFVDEIPHTATGKIQKIALRERFKDYVLPTAAASDSARIRTTSDGAIARESGDPLGRIVHAGFAIRAVTGSSARGGRYAEMLPRFTSRSLRSVIADESARQAIRMQRRRFSTDFRSPSGRAAARCFRSPAVLLAIVIVRAGLIEIDAVARHRSAPRLALAVLAIMLALAALVVIWRDGIDGLGRAVAAIVIGVALLAYPAYLGTEGLPAAAHHRHHHRSRSIRRASRRLARLRAARYQFDHLSGSAAAAAAARRLSRHRAAVASTPPAQVAYDAAMPSSPSANGAIVDARRPRPARRPDRGGRAHADHGLSRRRRGARARGADGGSRIDVRSASRYGHHDFGTNAARVRSLLDDIDDTAAPAWRTERNRKAPAEAPAPPTKRRLSRPSDSAPSIDGAPVGRHHAARHQVLEMREHREAGGLVSRGSSPI